MKSIVRKFVRVLTLFLVLQPAFASVDGNADELCAPFAESQMDQSFIAEMLTAASNGSLFRIEPDSSRMGFCVQGPTGLVRAEFKQFNGGLTFQGADAKKAKTLVALDVSSLVTDTLFADGMLKSAQFLDVETYPQIFFAGHTIEWINPRKAVLKGDLTMHGVTREVAFYVELSSPRQQSYAKEKLSIKASTTISRAEFGMRAFAPAVDDRVTLCMQVEAVRYQVDAL